MRITTTLRRQHIDFMFKKHWQLQGKRTVQETSAAASLMAKGIKVVDPQAYLSQFDRKNTLPRLDLKIDNLFEKQLPLDENHPEYKAQGCYVFGDSNVLAQGTQQTQVLLNTLIFDGMPEEIDEKFRNIKIPADVERSMQQSVLVSHLLDAEQQKTEKIVNPLRPMRPYPRNYGITENRKNMLLSLRLLNHCERFSGRSIASDRRTIRNALFVVPLEKGEDKIQLELTAETFVSTRKPIQHFKSNGNEMEIPDIFPLKETVSIPKLHFYKFQNAYPIKPKHQYVHPHTILLNYSKLDVKNLHETPVTRDQFESRAMLKGFAAAASRAQSLYGNDIKELEKPIVVQVVQFESKRVQFGVFQLNTLDLSNESKVKNFWFSKRGMDLYDECHYNNGRPALTSYNFDVFRLMNVFYNN